MDKVRSRKHRISQMVKGFRKYKISSDFFEIFDDLDKLKCLNSMLRNRSRSGECLSKFHNTAEEYKNLVIRFYFCERFNYVYKTWVESGKKPYLKPSVDHWVPKAIGGDNSLGNLKILSFMQNRAKGDMSEDDWLKVVKDPEKYFY